MALTHAILPAERWFMDLVASVGSLVYVVVLFAVGLPPDERAALVAMARKVLGRRSATAG